MRALASAPGLAATLAASLALLAGCAGQDAQNQQVMAELDRTTAALRAARAGVLAADGRAAQRRDVALFGEHHDDVALMQD